MNQTTLYAIALTKLPKVGIHTARKLVDYFGDARTMFEQSNKDLEVVPGIGQATSTTICQGKTKALEIAEAELEYMELQSIEAIVDSDRRFPFRLKQCADAPHVIYVRGDVNLNNRKVVSVVGTRAVTAYGQSICSQLISDLAKHNPLIISGLAYGVDAIAHQSAMNENLQTVGVLAHGLSSIYPVRNRKLADDMCKDGGLITEFTSDVLPEKEFFPRRNRIVAGLSDVTVVVESAAKGGSLITARLAQEYNREVAAFPGDVGRTYSAGCNEMIRTQRAALIQSAEDLEQLMNWDKPTEKKPSTTPIDLTPEQEEIVRMILLSGTMSIDQMVRSSGLQIAILSSRLLELEFLGVVESLPGKMYCVV